MADSPNRSLRRHLIDVRPAFVLGQVGIGLTAGGFVCLASASAHALSNPGRALSLLGYMYSYGGGRINSIGPVLAFGVPAILSTVLSCSVGRLDRLRGTLRIAAGLCVVHVSFPLCVGFADYEILWLDKQSLVELFGLNHIVGSLSFAVAGIVPVHFIREVLAARRRERITDTDGGERFRT